MKKLSLIALASLACAMPGSLMAWGGSGHRMVGELAMRALPSDLPAFLRTPRAVADVGEAGFGDFSDQGVVPAQCFGGLRFVEGVTRLGIRPSLKASFGAAHVAQHEQIQALDFLARPRCFA